MPSNESPFGGAHPFDEFQIGDQVEHPKWGVGTILFRGGMGEKAKVIVVFPDEGQKKLALKFAKLKRIQEAKPPVAAPAPAPVEKAPHVEEAEEEKGLEDLEDLEKIEGLEEEEEALLPEDLEKEIAFGEDEEGEIKELGEDEDTEGN